MSTTIKSRGGGTSLIRSNTTTQKIVTHQYINQSSTSYNDQIQVYIDKIKELNEAHDIQIERLIEDANNRTKEIENLQLVINNKTCEYNKLKNENKTLHRYVLTLKDHLSQFTDVSVDIPILHEDLIIETRTINYYPDDLTTIISPNNYINFHSTILLLNGEIMRSFNLIRHNRNIKTNLEENLASLTLKYNTLITNSNNKYLILNTENTNLKDEIVHLNQRINQLENQLKNKENDLNKKIFENVDAIKNKDKEISKINKDNENKVLIYQMQINDLHQKISTYESTANFHLIENDKLKEEFKKEIEILKNNHSSEINQISNTIRQKDVEISSLKKIITETESGTRNMKTEYDDAIKEYMNRVISKDNTIKSLQNTITEDRLQKEELNIIINQLKDQIQTKTSENETSSKKVNSLMSGVNEYIEKYRTAQSDNSILLNNIKNLKYLIEQKDDTIHQLENQYNRTVRENSRNSSHFDSGLSEKVAELNQLNISKDEEISDLMNINNENDIKISQLNNTISQQNRKIDQLNNTINILTADKSKLETSSDQLQQRLNFVINDYENQLKNATNYFHKNKTELLNNNMNTLKSHDMKSNLDNLGYMEQIQILRKLYNKELRDKNKYYFELLNIEGSISVLCNVKSFANNVSDEDLNNIISYRDENSFTLNNARAEANTYEYNYIFDHKSDFFEILNYIKRYYISLFEGHNLTLFSYGCIQSASSFTMKGVAKWPGLIYSSLNEMFDIVMMNKEYNNSQISISIVEINNDEIRDLCMDNNIKITTDTAIKIIEINNINDGMNLVNNAYNQIKTMHNGLTIGATLIITIYVKTASNIDSIETNSRLTLVDLVNYEPINDSNISALRNPKSNYNNISLTVLGDVLSSLANKQKKAKNSTNFKNSSLIELLHNSISEDVKIIFITSINIGDKNNTNDIIHSLQYTNRFSRKSTLSSLLSQSAIIQNTVSSDKKLTTKSIYSASRSLLGAKKQ